MILGGLHEVDEGLLERGSALPGFLDLRAGRGDQADERSGLTARREIDQEAAEADLDPPDIRARAELHLELLREAAADDLEAFRSGPRAQLVGRAHLEQPSLVDDGDLRAERLRLHEVVRREEHGRTILLRECGEIPSQRGRGERVEARGRLVEEDEAWPMNEGARDGQPLFHAATPAGDDLVASVPQPDVIEQRADARTPLRAGQVPDAPVQLEVVPRAEALV